MRVGIIGAGVAGLSTAKVLTQVGHEVVVLDRTPDVGGVWSRTRRYPGLTTQNTRDTYALSDFPMPVDYPEWPSGAQVQAYLAAYAERFGVDRLLRLQHEVVRAEPGDAGWTLTVRDLRDGSTRQEDVDHLVVANGVFCEPVVPAFEGERDFTAAGGRLCAATELHDVQEARDRHVVVVGYGKSACDVAAPVSDVAASTDVVARQLLWKVPKKVGGVLNYKHLLLTRLGENLFRFQHLRGVEKVLHGPGNGLRRRMLTSVGAIASRQSRLADLGLVPPGTMEDIIRHAISLVTDGFYERVADGRITVHRDRTVARLLVRDGAPHAELGDGTVLPADLVVCGTGYRQGQPFFDQALQDRLRDDRGNIVLYRQILPLDVPRLTFAGYNSSFFSPLNAEMAAVWIAAHLAGRVDLPAQEEMRARVRDRLAFLDDALAGHHQQGTKIIPFSLHHLDEVLGDVGLNIGPLRRALQWLRPVDPSAYRSVAHALARRLAPAGAAPGRAVPASTPA